MSIDAKAHTKKYSLLQCWLVSMLCTVFCLSTVIFVDYLRRVDVLKAQVERSSLDLLGYIEFNENNKFYIKSKYTADAKKLISSEINSGSGGFAYILNVTTGEVIWSTVSWLSGGLPHKKQHGYIETLAENNLEHKVLSKKPAFFPAEAKVVTMPATVNAHETSYMTATQNFSASEKTGGEHYSMAVAKTMYPVQDELMGLINKSIFGILLLNLLFALIWLGSWLIAKVKWSSESRILRSDIPSA